MERFAFRRWWVVIAACVVSAGTVVMTTATSSAAHGESSRNRVSAAELLAAPGAEAMNRDLVRERVIEALPKKLQTLTPGISTRAEAEKALGRPARTQGPHQWLYNIAGKDFDTTVVFSGEKVRAIYHDFWPNRMKLGEFRARLSEDRIREARREARREAPNAPPSHEKGHGFIVKIPESGLRLGVLDTPERLVDYAWILEPGKDSP